MRVRESARDRRKMLAGGRGTGRKASRRGAAEMRAERRPDLTEFNVPGTFPTWCPGCGDFGLWNALKRALVELGRDPSQTVIVSGIGCSGKVPYWVRTYGFCGLHGRPIPVATAVKLANHELDVFAVSGDGDGYAEGTNHLVHAARRNIDITYIVHNNQIYGLTVGQASPTSDQGFKTRSSPFGVCEPPLNPLALAIAAGATFVARGFAAHLPELTRLIVEATRHKGFALVDVLQPCVTLNHLNSYDWYGQRVYYVEKERDYKPRNKVWAFGKALEWDHRSDGRIPCGVIYREKRPVFEECYPQIAKVPLVKQPIDRVDVARLLEEFR